jgi:hypothetical protein
MASCKDQPSEKEISQCILNSYTCGNYAKINHLQIINSHIDNFMGTKSCTVYVNGEIEWLSNCQTGFFSVIPAGKREVFQNKSVFLVKMDNGWGCP